MNYIKKKNNCSFIIIIVVLYILFINYSKTKQINVIFYSKYYNARLSHGVYNNDDNNVVYR